MGRRRPRPARATSTGLRWPDGARCAVALSFDVDGESSLFSSAPADTHRRHTGLSTGTYERIAVPRILDGLGELGVRQTFCVPAWTAERHWDVLERILSDGHEIAAHGYLHEEQRDRSREQEAEAIAAALDSFDRLCGYRPTGWRGPSFAFGENTADLLVEHGFRYDSTLTGGDEPYALQCESGGLWELPLDPGAEDWAQYAAEFDYGEMVPVRTARNAVEVWREAIDAMRRAGGIWVAAWHPPMVGRPARFEAMMDLIRWIQSLGDVWLATLGEIADHLARLVEAGEFEPRVDRLPYFRSADAGSPAPAWEAGVLDDRLREQLTSVAPRDRPAD